MLAALSWAAVLLGFVGTWVAGRHRTGWLIGAACSALWLAYDVDRAIWAGALAATVGIVLGIRNYSIGGDRL
jgi:hypothetical protein